jgi:hypothetical protein
VRFEVLTAVKIHVDFFCAVMLRSVAVGYQRFSMKMEAEWTSETSVSYHKIARRQSPEERDLNPQYIFLI